MCWLRRTPAAILSAVCLAILAAGATAEERPQVHLRIDFGDDQKAKLAEIPWRDGMTVLDVMQSASKQDDELTFQYRGKQATAFLTQIGKVKNEGRGRNWLFYVNDKIADRSFAVYRIMAGDTVLWKFAEYR